MTPLSCFILYIDEITQNAFNKHLHRMDSFSQNVSGFSGYQISLKFYASIILKNIFLIFSACVNINDQDDPSLLMLLILFTFFKTDQQVSIAWQLKIIWGNSERILFYIFNFILMDFYFCFELKRLKILTIVDSIFSLLLEI